MIPEDLLYTDQHEWVKVDGQVATVGITFHAQQALSDITFVELPAIGHELTAGAEACALESCKAAGSVYAPADGKVIEANIDLDTDPGLINTDCYEKGWIYKMEMSSAGVRSGLMTAEQYGELLAEQG